MSTKIFCFGFGCKRHYDYCSSYWSLEAQKCPDQQPTVPSYEFVSENESILK